MLSGTGFFDCVSFSLGGIETAISQLGHFFTQLGIHLGIIINTREITTFLSKSNTDKKLDVYTTAKFIIM